MPLKEEIQKEIYNYCYNHLPSGNWYQSQLCFIEDIELQKRLIEEFKGIRFAYKLYEGISAKDENLIFQIRYQLFAYATIYEAIINYLLCTYYNDTDEVKNLYTKKTLKTISIPTNKINQLKKLLFHDGKDLITCYSKIENRTEPEIRFTEKCDIAEKLNLIHKFHNPQGKLIDLPKEIKEIYSRRNGIHLIAEQKKGFKYELELSRLAYRRLKPFLEQVSNKLKIDKKSIYK